MKAAMMVLAPLWFLLCWTSPVGSAEPSHDNPTALSMEEGSVDDMYLDCSKDMKNLVNKDFLKKEKEDMLWDHEITKDCAKRNVEQNTNTALTKDQMQAICVFTGGVVYKKFTPAVKTSSKDYGTTFKFHSLHYLLTSAIQILNPDSDICHTVYRRTNFIFTGEINQIIRFGFFASTSLKPDFKPESFGSNSCFKVLTCLGAYVAKYAHIEEQEEVAIPPYEKFKITGICDGEGAFAEMADCKRVFTLESVGAKSKLNCKIASTKTKPIDKIIKFFHSLAD